jgi:CBS domain-containing protein
LAALFLSVSAYVRGTRIAGVAVEHLRATGGFIMTVRDIMSEPVVTCRPDTPLSTAAKSMREADYGTLPVVDLLGRLAGIITDRDICLAVAGSARNAAHIAVHEVMTRKVVTVSITNDLHTALHAMKTARVRRLPVVDDFGHLKGLLSIEDVVVRGLETGGISTDEIVMALRTMYERRPAMAESELT